MDLGVKFDGMHERIHKEKLPEGLCVSEQNADHRTRELWTPRQGLARAAGLARLTARIDSVGWGECGLKTGLIRCASDGKIYGDSIGGTDVSAVWNPPPPRGFFYDPPTLTVEQTGSTTATLTATSTNPYVIGYIFYAGGEYLAFDSDGVYEHTDFTEDTVYSAEAVLEDGTASEPATDRVIPHEETAEDDFDRPDGTLTDPPYDWWTQGNADSEIYDARFKGDTQALVWIETGKDFYLPIATRSFLWHDGLAGASSNYGWGLRVIGSGEQFYGVVVQYEYSANRWRLGIYRWQPTSTTSYSGYTSGVPPLTTLSLSVNDDIVRAIYSNVTLTLGLGTTITEPCSTRMILEADSAINKRIGLGYFFLGGGTP
ncbi:MAG: hypothetical protein ACYTBJ_01935 [Planctomycetota bacterium]